MVETSYFKDLNLETTGRIVGVLILLEFVLGVLVKQIYLGPESFNLAFFYGLNQRIGEVSFGITLGLLNALIAVGILILIIPIVESRLRTLRNSFVVTTAAAFVLAASEMFWILDVRKIKK